MIVVILACVRTEYCHEPAGIVLEPLLHANEYAAGIEHELARQFYALKPILLTNELHLHVQSARITEHQALCK